MATGDIFNISGEIRVCGWLGQLSVGLSAFWDRACPETGCQISGVSASLSVLLHLPLLLLVCAISYCK